MTNLADNLDTAIDRIMMRVNVEECLVRLQDFGLSKDRLAPQEMDRLVDVLFAGLRLGFGEVISKNIKNREEQQRVIQTSVSGQLKEAEADLDMKNLEKKFNVADFSAQILAALIL
jgi:hypothetical protein